MKVLYQIIIFCLLFNIIEKMLKPVLYILLSLKLCFIFITIMAYTNTYSLWFDQNHEDSEQKKW